jgi:hypothetical protein
VDTICPEFRDEHLSQKFSAEMEFCKIDPWPQMVLQRRDDVASVGWQCAEFRLGLRVRVQRGHREADAGGPPERGPRLPAPALQ